MKNTRKYYYRVYGLNIESDIKIDEFLESDIGKINVKIIQSEMPENINEIKLNGKKHYCSNSKVWFDIEGVASYYITDGNIVNVEFYGEMQSQISKVYIMCSCLGFIMFQKEMVAIHGGTSVINGQGVIITGNRGAGKSTLTTSLRMRGYPFISDDVAATYMDKVPYIYPGFPYQKLCEDAMDNFDYDKSKYSSFMSDNKIKYMVPADKEFINYNVPLTTIVELVAGDVNEVILDEIKGAEKLAKLIKNIYRGEYIGLMGGMTPGYFKKCLNIAQNINFYKITRPRDGFTVNKQIELIEKALNSNRKEKVV